MQRAHMSGDIKGLCKVNKIFQKSKIKLARAHDPSKLFLETHDRHGQNNKIKITNNFQQSIYKQNTQGILLKNMNTRYLLRAILGRKKEKKNSDCDLDSLAGICGRFYFAKPLTKLQYYEKVSHAASKLNHEFNQTHIASLTAAGSLDWWKHEI